MDYGIIGLGPVGAMFAVHLKQAGHSVAVLDENRFKLDYLKKNPLRIRGKANAVAQLEDLHDNMIDFVGSGPKVVLICTKSCATRDLARELKAHGIAESTMFVSCQNGLDVEEILANEFGSNRVLRMILNFGVQFVNKSEVSAAFCFDQYMSKKEECHPHDQEIAADLEKAGLSVKVVDNYRKEVFKKAILNSALGSVCALTRMTMKQVMDEPELVRLVRELLREAIAVGDSRGFELHEFFQPAMDYLEKGGDHKPSMLMDIERGHVTENEFHCGQIFRYAEEAKIEAPVIQTVYYLIKNLERAIILDSYVTKNYELGG